MGFSVYKFVYFVPNCIIFSYDNLIKQCSSIIRWTVTVLDAVGE